MGKKNYKDALPLFSVTHSVSSAGFEFDYIEDKWDLSRNVRVNVEVLKRLPEGQSKDVREVLVYYAENLSAYLTSNIVDSLVFYFKTTNETELSVPGFSKLKRKLDKKHEWRISVLRGFIRQMRYLHLDRHIDEAIYKLVDQWTLAGNDKGAAVLSLDPLKGPFSSHEFEALGSVSAQKYSEGAISTEDYATILLFKSTGRRPDQIASLKVKDFRITNSLTGTDIYVANIPRAKQRNGGFRKNFREYGLEEYVGQVLEKFRSDVCRKARFFAGRPLSEEEKGELPLFISDNGQKEIGLNANRDLLEYLRTELPHEPRRELSSKLVRIVKKMGVVSERTGELVHANPYRFRYTLGTRAAIEGAGKLTIAILLDQSDLQNVDVYVRNVPEYAVEISKIMNQPLARYASAFAGKIVKDESEANLENHGATRIPLQEKNCDVGSCGSSAYCQDYAPVACYLCPKFRPWAHAPHHLVLVWLMEERERLKVEAGDLAIVTINDRAIVAVCQVIKLCEERNNV